METVVGTGIGNIGMLKDPKHCFVNCRKYKFGQCKSKGFTVNATAWPLHYSHRKSPLPRQSFFIVFYKPAVAFKRIPMKRAIYQTKDVDQTVTRISASIRKHPFLGNVDLPSFDLEVWNIVRVTRLDIVVRG